MQDMLRRGIWPCRTPEYMLPHPLPLHAAGGGDSNNTHCRPVKAESLFEFTVGTPCLLAEIYVSLKLQVIRITAVVEASCTVLSICWGDRDIHPASPRLHGTNVD
jgi:hypothetical protein